MFSKNERFNRWSIRKVTVGVASVIVASGVFFLVGGADAHAAEVSDNSSAITTVAKADTSNAEVEKSTEVKVDKEVSPKAEVAEEKVEAPKETPSEVKEEVKESAVVADRATVDKKEVAEEKVEKEEAAVTTPAEVQKAVVENTKSEVDVPASYLDRANFPGPFTAGVNQVIPYEFFGGDGMLTRLILNSSDKAPWSDNGVDKNAALLPLEKLGNGQYFYEVDLDGVAKGKSDKELLDILKAQGTQSYKAVIKVYAAKDGKADLNHVVATKDLSVHLNGVTTPAEVQKAVVENTKSEVDVPASYLDRANFPGPFTAGVNQVIPYEFFGGDGMLTRLILNSSDKAPWSDNGVDKNAALLPLEKLGNGQYFYEVDLDGVAKGKSDKELLDILKAQGTQNYKAVIKVYAAKDGKADLNHVVATKDLSVHLNGVTTPAQVQKAVVENTKSEVDVPASYLDKANFPGPFTAGVNQVIPYEFFGGDGMLTRLILNSSDKAPWSDNGVDKNAALLPLEKLGNGQYFYEVDLDGVAKGKSDKELLDILKATGTQSYKAVIKVYAAKDGKADLNHLVATKELTIKLHKEMKEENHQMMNQNHKMMNKKDSMMSSNHEMMQDEQMSMMQSQNMNEKSMMPMSKMSKNNMMLPKTSADTTSSKEGLVATVVAMVLAFFGLRRKGNN